VSNTLIANTKWFFSVTLTSFFVHFLFIHSQLNFCWIPVIRYNCGLNKSWHYLFTWVAFPRRLSLCLNFLETRNFCLNLNLAILASRQSTLMQYYMLICTWVDWTQDQNHFASHILHLTIQYILSTTFTGKLCFFSLFIWLEFSTDSFCKNLWLFSRQKHLQFHIKWSRYPHHLHFLFLLLTSIF
jgi:hypothetical protein